MEDKVTKVNFADNFATVGITIACTLLFLLPAIMNYFFPMAFK